MKGADWLLSLAIHGTVIGAATFSLLRTPSAPEAEPIPIYFEVVEAAAIEAEAEPVPAPEESAVPAIEEGPAPEGEAEGFKERLDEPDGSREMDEGAAADEPKPDERPVAERDGEAQMPAEQEERAKVVSAPIALNRIVPVYPRSARRRGHEGCVTVAVSVAEDGRIVHAEVVASSGYGELDAAALAAVRTAHFAPATEDGVSVRGELRLTFDFRLR